MADTPLAAGIAFEPGGQVELNLPCAPGLAALDVCFTAAVSELRRRCGDAGVRLEATPVDPRPLDQLPLQLLSDRYLAMQAHFDRIGPAGRRMMRQTAGTQVCLDWWPGRAGLEQWRLLLLAGPFLAAALNHSSRLATWLDVDPSRTGFDDRLLHGDDPVAAYADFAAGATAFVPAAEHLSTLFPPVRPRGSVPRGPVPGRPARRPGGPDRRAPRRPALRRRPAPPGAGLAGVRAATAGRALADRGAGPAREIRGRGGMSALFVTDPLAGWTPASTAASG